MILYEIARGYLGEILDDSLIAPASEKKYTREQPPELLPGEYALWIGHWTKTTVPPMPPEPEYDTLSQRLHWSGSEWIVIEVDSMGEDSE
jgi:hypothetical protein